IVSGLSHAVLIIEAGKDSGSLITARLALDDNRDVFALPGRIDSPMSQGTNEYIVKSQAHMLLNYEDLLREMGWAFAPLAKKGDEIVELYGKEKEIYELLSTEPTHFDVLIEQSGLAAGELSATLTMLELGG